MAKSYVVDGASVQCSLSGGTTSKLEVDKRRTVYIDNKAQANIKDTNIKKFGRCSVPKHHQCRIKVSPTWQGGKNDVEIDGVAALVHQSTIRCLKYAGVIRIIKHNQCLETDGAVLAPITVETPKQVETKETKVKGSTGRYIWPTKGTVTSVFGERTPPVWYDKMGVRHQGSTQHMGWDIANAMGTIIVACSDGDIIFSGEATGNTIVINHGRIYSYYFHLDSFIITTGHVTKGQLIAKMGMTGGGTGPHLHFAISPRGTIFKNYVDPLKYLPVPQYPLKTTAVYVDSEGKYHNK